MSCSCGQLCKSFRGLKLHQIKAKCQASENKLTGPNKRCFVSLTDILNTSFLKFGDNIYCKTPSNTFVPICNFDKPISATQCFVETNDNVIDPTGKHRFLPNFVTILGKTLARQIFRNCSENWNFEFPKLFQWIEFQCMEFLWKSFLMSSFESTVFGKCLEVVRNLFLEGFENNVKFGIFFVS